MRVIFYTSGRFYLADLARELLRLGHSVRFHSMVPRRSLEQFGLPPDAQKCHLLSVLPFVVMRRKLRLGLKSVAWLDTKIQRILDLRYSRLNEKGDVSIGMSGLFVKSLESDNGRGIKTVVERASSHISCQKEILDKLTAAGDSLISKVAFRREIESYERAWRITVPSTFALESFIERGFASNRLFCNPLGVDISEFYPDSTTEKTFDVIMVGTWCRRKGCDLLAKVVLDELRLSLLHVGPEGDIPFPVSRRFSHVDSVPQNLLRVYYSKASVFVMPSREEGFGMVYTQALACGLPIVGTTNSGVRDIARLTRAISPTIQVVPSENHKALKVAIAKAIDHVDNNYNVDHGEQDWRSLSWRSYAMRYEEYLLKNI